MEKDRGYPELGGYLVQADVVSCRGLLLLLRRRPVYAAWGVVFGIALLDDGLHLHERLGGRLVRVLDLPAEIAGVDRQSIGELAVFGVLSVVPLLAVVVLHRREDAQAREHSRVLAVLLGALVFFGVVVDVLHSVVGGSGDVAMVFGLVEDGGELVVLSVTLAVLAGWAAAVPHHEAAAPAQPLMGDAESPRPVAQL